ncbi:MAG TPA: dTDP-4-dehydrorhamnose reductase [Actinomycetota bacterium]
MKLLVTGSGGGLGRAFLAQVPAHHQVHECTHSDLDIGDHGAVRATVPLLAPDVVINFAAFTAVDANESDPERAFRDNAVGPQNLALAARDCGATVVHVSTDYVFDGTKGAPYDETDTPAPLSVYGRSKLAGERFVRDLVPSSFIVRVGHVYGGGADYLTEATKRMAAGGSAGGLTDRIGSPTYVGHLAERLLPLVLTGRFGTYHLAGPQPASWFDVLTRVRELGGLTGEVQPQLARELALPAPRPANCALTSVFVDGLGSAPMPSLDVGLEAFLQQVLSPS